MSPQTFTLAAITCFVLFSSPTSGFIPWRPSLGTFDPQSSHALDPPSHAARRLDSAIRRAEFKFNRGLSVPAPAGNPRVPTEDSITPKKRQSSKDNVKTSGPIGLDSDPADISYWVEAKFGTSTKTFRLVLDTGSADTWIPSSECSSKSCLVHETHGPLDSKTLDLSSNETFSIRYASGNVDGVIVQDTMTLGSISLSSIRFGLAKTVSDDFITFPIDGILGLGFPAASTQNVPIFIENLISQNIVTKRIFGVHLHRSSDGQKNGSVVFGDMDEARVDGGREALKLYPLTPDSGLWSISLEDMILNGESAKLSGGRKAVVDTGTSLILIPPEDALKLHQFMPRAQSNGETFYIPCDTQTRLEFVFGSDKYEVLPRDYIGEPVDTGRDLCLSLIVGKSVLHDGAWLIGDIFLKNVYSVFDMDNLQVGFGKLARSIDSPSSIVSPSSSTHDEPTHTETRLPEAVDTATTSNSPDQTSLTTCTNIPSAFPIAFLFVIVSFCVSVY